MIELEPEAHDAPDLLARIQELVRGAAAHHGCENVYVVRIDNWFGRKWVGFSHKAFGHTGLHHTAPGYVLPPFVPARVLSERRFTLDPRGDYRPATHEHPLHVAQLGSMNRYRRVTKQLGEAALLWFASRSAETGRGALMAYHPTPDGHEGWYVGFARSDDGWRVVESERIAPRTLELFARAGTETAHERS